MKIENDSSLKTPSPHPLPTPITKIYGNIPKAKELLSQTTSPVLRRQLPSMKICRKKPKPREADFFVQSSFELKDEALLECIKDHASARIQLFATSALVLYRAGIQSNNLPRDVRIGIAAAELQIGTGSKSHPACHMNVAAGLIDNFRCLFMNETLSSKTISPEKGAWLTAKGFKPQDIVFLQKHAFSKDSIHWLFSYRWPEKRQHSILSELAVNRTLQGTTILQRDINLVCDKRLETAIRQSVIEIYFQVIHGEITPKVATEKLVTECKNCLASIVQTFSLYEEALNQYLNYLNALKNAPNDQKLQKEIDELYKSLKNLGASSRLEAKEFSLFLKHQLKSPDSLDQSFQALLKNVIENTRSLTERAQRNKRFSEAELEGTSMVNFEHHCGGIFDLDGNEFTYQRYMNFKNRLLNMENINAHSASDLSEEEYEEHFSAYLKRTNREKRFQKLIFEHPAK